MGIRPTGTALAGLTLGLMLGLARPLPAMDFPGPDPGKAQGEKTASRYLSLSNQALRLSWSTFGGRLVPATLRDRLAGRDLEPAKEAFVLEFHDGTRLKASRMQASGFKVESVPGMPNAVGEAERIPGQRVSALLEATDGLLHVEWQATLRDGSNYVRQEIAITPRKGAADLAKVVMVDHWLPGADIVGRVGGSPVVAGTVFTGFEHPMSVARLEAGGFPRIVPVPGSEDSPLAPDRPAVRESPEAAPRWAKAHVQCWLEL